MEDELDRLFADEEDDFSVTVRAAVAKAKAVPAKAVPATPVKPASRPIPTPPPTPVPAVPVPDDAIQVYDKGGRGRKECPACKKFVGNRNAQCACGHVFASKAPKVKLPEAPLPLAVDSENAPGGRLRVVSTPSGRCPVQLESPNPTDVERWAHSVVAKGQERGIQYAVRALKYWVRDFFDINGEFHNDFKHQTVCGILDKMFAA